MRYILDYLGFNHKAKSQSKSPVYSFFTEISPVDKKRAYKSAILSAEKEQKDLISRYEKEFAGISS